MNKRKCLRLLLSGVMGVIISFALTTNAYAKIISYVAQDNDEVIGFNLDGLIQSYTNKLAGSSAPMFDTYLEYAPKLIGFYDDKTGLVSLDFVIQAYTNNAISCSGSAFNIDAVTESASNENIINALIGYECNYNDGKIVPLSALEVVPTGASISIPDIKVRISPNEQYTPPRMLTAVMNGKSIANIKVVWDKQVDTSTKGTFIYTGTIVGYSGKIHLTLNIDDVSMGNKQ